MDPFSISIGALQLISFAGNFVKGLSSFIEKTKNIDKSIQDLHDEILHLYEALERIRNTIRKRTRQLPFEREHHANIRQIIQSCEASLRSLHQELPPLHDGSQTPIKRIQHAIVQCLKEDKVQHLLRRITSYRSLLQMSLETLSFGHLMETERSQKKIEAEVRKLSILFQSSQLFGHINYGNTLLERTRSVESEVESEYSEENTLEKEISDWGRTAHDLKSAVSLDHESSCGGSSVALDLDASVETLTLYDDTYDPEPSRLDRQSEILEFQLNHNKEMVHELMQCGLVIEASRYQRQGIELLKELSGIPILLDDPLYDQLATMREELADILVLSECSRPEAKSELLKLLDEEVKKERETGYIDYHRRGRLYHKLGQLYLGEKNLDRARPFLGRALDDRKQINPMPHELVKESAELLVEVYRQEQAFDRASGLSEWIKRELQPDSLSSSTSTSLQTMHDQTGNSFRIDLTYAYQWCKEQRMDVDSATFHFNTCDPETGTTPLHRAIQAENIEVVQHMLHLVDKEQRDKQGSTLLHEAASTRNRNLCALLLDKHLANPDVVDDSGRTPLHRCQTRSGGLGVAELLLKSCPQLINRPEYYGKTALYLACEKGNQKMVEALLSAGADPNIPGPGQVTPLILAIDVAARSAQKISIVKLLMKYGADPRKTDAAGKTAFDAVDGLASKEIRLMLESSASRRTSTMTMKSIRSSSSRTSSSTTAHSSPS
ncbi:ankyrin [Hypoxylon trugodes]|uniref:ankyrin n=1 Tax=Hypoxylon trugodes TaxID=326681 RepID=UPI002199579A|nr:ankyrin [Hypoxylon trugodes]KAI1387895.1 ankyrin [Hypoxylon trugodes]